VLLSAFLLFESIVVSRVGLISVRIVAASELIFLHTQLIS
jgi:hypothetical protein